MRIEPDPGPVEPGVPFSYRITIGNIGNSNPDGVHLQMRLPDGVTYVSDNGGGLLEDNVISWDVGTLGVGSSGQVVVSVLPDAQLPDGTLLRVEARLDSGIGTETIQQAAAISAVRREPPLKVTYTVDQSSVEPGSATTYTVKVVNTSTVDITDIVGRITTPGGINSFTNPGGLNCNGSCRNFTLYTWDIGVLGPGQEFIRTFSPSIRNDVSRGAISTSMMVVTATGSNEVVVRKDVAIGSLVWPRATTPAFRHDPNREAVVNAPYVYVAQAVGNPAPTYNLTTNPSGMTIDENSGRIEWLPQAPGEFEVTVVATNSEGSVTQNFTISVMERIAPTLTTTALPEGYTDIPYTFTLDATGSPSPQFELLDAPLGMTVDPASGQINWTPTMVGAFNVNVQVSNIVDTVTAEYPLVVSQAITPGISSTPVLNGTRGERYTYVLTAAGNPAPTFALLTAPAGMNLNENTGEISWTPNSTGIFDVTIQAVNVVGTDVQSFSITVVEPLAAPAFLSVPETDAIVGLEYVYTPQFTGNPQPVFSLNQSPAGMSIDSVTGVLSWAPEAPMTVAIELEAVNSEGMDTQNFMVTAREPVAPNIVSAPPTSAEQDVLYVYQVEASGIPFPNFTLLSAPEGMSIDADTGQIEWTPTRPGFFDVEVQVENIVNSAIQAFSIEVNAKLEGFMLTTSIDNFGNTGETTNYRLVSIPGSTRIPIKDTFHGRYKENWRAFRDNGVVSQIQNIYLIEYDESSAFDFAPGRGFMVLGKGSWPADTMSAEPVELENNTFSIPVTQNQWHILGNPFNKSVQWADVVTLNELNPEKLIYQFEEEYSPAMQLEPYHAYYYQHDTTTTELRIPYPIPNSGKNSTGATSDDGMKLKLALYEDGEQKTFVKAIIAPAARMAKDAYDQVAPRSNMGSIAMYIENHSVDSVYSSFVVEARPAVDEGQTFNVTLQPQTGVNQSLRVFNQNQFSDFQLYLIDRSTGALTNLHEDSTVVVSSADQIARYSLLIGNGTYIDQQLQTLLPEHLVLTQNYPNPFSTSTTIEYFLPRAQHVHLAVFDMLGRKLLVLTDGQQDQGIHQFIWDGRGPGRYTLPDGVYFLRLTTSSGERETLKVLKVQ